MKNIFCILIIAFLMCACNEHRVPNVFSFSLVNEARISDIVKDYQLIRLETVEENLILDPTIVKFAKDRIFILDRFSPSKGLYVFQIDGKYLGKVGCKGEGPGEYIMPHYFSVNEKYNRIFLRDMAMNRMLVYDLTTLAFVEDFSIPFYATCFEELDKDHWIWYINVGLQNQGDFRKHLQITDLKCNPLISAVAPLPLPERGLYNVQSYFFASEETTYFHHPFQGDYSSCSLQDSVLHQAFSLSFTDLPFPTLDYVVDHKEGIIKSLEADRYIQWCDVVKNAGTCLCYFGTGKEVYWGVYDEAEAKGWYVSQEKLVDDLGIGKLTRPKGTYRGYFVSFIPIEGLQADELPDNSLLKPYVGNGGIDGNPVLLLYK